MNKINILIISTLFCCACNNEAPKQEEQPLADTVTTEIPPHTIAGPVIEGTYVVDDYPITDDMLSDSAYSHFLISGNLKVFDQAWFSNDSLGQLIVISLATDYYHMDISHFYTRDIMSLLDYLNLSFVNKADNIATKKEIEKDWHGFVKQAKKAGSEYFTTNKGVTLGDSLHKIMNIYGLPDSTSIKNDITRYQWTYNGIDPEFWDTTIPKSRPLAKESIGHSIVMLFKNDKLIAQILHNEIP